MSSRSDESCDLQPADGCLEGDLGRRIWVRGLFSLLCLLFSVSLCPLSSGTDGQWHIILFKLLTGLKSLRVLAFISFFSCAPVHLLLVCRETHGVEKQGKMDETTFLRSIPHWCDVSTCDCSHSFRPLLCVHPLLVCVAQGADKKGH